MGRCMSRFPGGGEKSADTGHYGGAGKPLSTAGARRLDAGANLGDAEGIPPSQPGDPAMMLRSLLACPGIELSECADGAEALGAYHDFRPDWVFMDSVMKNVDGISATRLLLNSFPEAQVLMVSEDDIEQLRRAARAAGARGFVTKDFLLQILTQNRGAPLKQLEPLWSASI